MKFGPIPIGQAEGKILGHNVAGSDGRRVLRKGKPLSADDIALLRRLGRSQVYVAELEPGDVDENSAAKRVAEAVTSPGLRLTGPSTGRVNLKATDLGVFRVDAARLAELNACSGITVATLRADTAVQSGKTVATVKVIPFAVPGSAVRDAEHIAAKGGPLIQVDVLPARKVALILSGSASASERILSGFDPPLRARLEALKATVISVTFIPLEDESGEADLARMLQQQLDAGAELIVLAGETAIMDRHDLLPRAVERAGGVVSCFGAPVDPGNLTMVAYLDEVPVLGAPGCARSRKANIIDWVLPRLLSGERLDHHDLVDMGHGGLLDDVPERPMPRSRV
jgi:molybdenum cofactor cytidylyltransferase